MYWGTLAGLLDLKLKQPKKKTKKRTSGEDDREPKRSSTKPVDLNSSKTRRARGRSTHEKMSSMIKEERLAAGDSIVFECNLPLC